MPRSRGLLLARFCLILDESDFDSKRGLIVEDPRTRSFGPPRTCTYHTISEPRQYKNSSSGVQCTRHVGYFVGKLWGRLPLRFEVVCICPSPQSCVKRSLTGHW